MVRRGAGRFAPASGRPAGFLPFAVGYFQLAGALTALLALAAPVVAPPRTSAGSVATVMVFGGLQAAASFWIAWLLEQRRPLGAYLTLGMTGLSLVRALAAGGGALDLVLPALGLFVAFGAWRELETAEAGGDEATRRPRPPARPRTGGTARPGRPRPAPPTGGPPPGQPPRPRP